MTTSQILTISATWGAVFAGFFSAIVLGGVLVARDAMLSDAPESVRASYGKPQSAKGRLVQRIMIALLLLAFVASAAGGLLALRAVAGGDIGFWPAFAFGAVMILILHLVDLIVLDWLVVSLWQPAFLMLPGTQGHPAYRDYWHHVRALFPRPVPWPILLIPIVGLMLAGITVLAEAIW